MRNWILAFTVVLILGLLAGAASAQTTLPVADSGAVEFVYWSYYYGQVGSTYFLRTSGLAGTYTFGTPTTFGSKVGRNYQAVAVFSLSTGMPYAASAPLSLSATSINGTWTLWAKLGSGSDSSVDTGDFVGGTGSFSSVGAFTTSATGSGTIIFDIKGFLNADLAAGNAFATYVLTHPGSNNVTSVGLSGPVRYTPVPEPGTLVLFGLGLVTLAAGYRIRSRKNK